MFGILIPQFRTGWLGYIGYAFRLTDWNINTFVGTNNDIDIAEDKVMLIGFKPIPAPYAYWVEEINNPLNYS